MDKPLIAKQINLGQRPKFKVMYVDTKEMGEALELAMNDGYAIGNVSTFDKAIVYVLVKS